MSSLQWLMDKGFEPEFDIFSAARIVGTDTATLQTWAARGITNFAGTRPGKSRKRLYSANDLVILQAALLLVQLGFKPSHAVSAAGQAFIDALAFMTGGVKRGETWHCSELAGAVALIGSSDNGVPNVRVAITGRHELPLTDLFSGLPVVTFACGRVFEQVAERARASRKQDA